MAFIRILFVMTLLLFSFNMLTSSRPLIDVELEDLVESFHGFVELPSRDDRELVEHAENDELEHSLNVNEVVKRRGGHQHDNGHRHNHHHGHHHHHGHSHGHQPRNPPRRKARKPAPTRADIVVAQHGSGNFRTINEAVVVVGRLRNGGERFTIHVKTGTYNEYVDISYDMENVTMIGDGIGKTLITGNKYGVATSESRTFGFGNSGSGSMSSGRVKGKGFHLIDEHEGLIYTVRNFLQGDDAWPPATEIHYASCL